MSIHLENVCTFPVVLCCVPIDSERAEAGEKRAKTEGGGGRTCVAEGLDGLVCGSFFANEFTSTEMV